MQSVEIVIVDGKSITEMRADFLLLKNLADGLYGPELGVDKATNGLLRKLNTPELTRAGETKIFSNIDGITARGIVLSGVGSKSAMNYETIGNLCAQSISLLATNEPKTKSIATVSHGVGFGLSRKEVFRSQLFSFKSALERHPLPLERIIFNELNIADGSRLKSHLEEIVQEQDSPVSKKGVHYYLDIGKNSIAVEKFEARVKEAAYVFVAMPFAAEFENIYDFGIQLPIEDNGLLPIRVDKQYFSGSIIGEIKSRIQESSLLIVDVTHMNPNVMYELGFAQGTGKDTIIICQKGEELPFDLKDMNIIFYDPLRLRELNKAISKAVKELLP